jgi:hypothetical protein
VNHEGDAIAQGLGLAKVGAYAAAEAFGFADIEDAIAVIPHQIHSRFWGDVFETLFEAIGLV